MAGPSPVFVNEQSEHVKPDGIPLFLQIQPDLGLKIARYWFWSNEISPIVCVIFEVTKVRVITLIVRGVWSYHGTNGEE